MLYIDMHAVSNPSPNVISYNVINILVKKDSYNVITDNPEKKHQNDSHVASFIKARLFQGFFQRIIHRKTTTDSNQKSSRKCKLRINTALSATMYKINVF